MKSLEPFSNIFNFVIIPKAPKSLNSLHVYAIYVPFCPVPFDNLLYKGDEKGR